MRSILFLCALLFVLGLGEVYSEQVTPKCTIPEGQSEVDKCDWGSRNKVTIGDYYEINDNKQILKLVGDVSACEKKDEMIISAELNVEVAIDTWLGRIEPKEMMISFDLRVGTTTTTVFVQELSEGTVWVKAEPDFSTARVQLWATYAINQDNSCAYITTDKLSISAPLESGALTISEPANSGSSTPTYVYVLAIVGAVLVFGALTFGVGVYFGKCGNKDIVDVPELDLKDVTRGSTVRVQRQSIQVAEV